VARLQSLFGTGPEWSTMNKEIELTAESRALIGENITSVEQIGHAEYNAFFVRTAQNPAGGWVTQDNPLLWAAACAVWAAIRSGRPFDAELFYTNRDRTYQSSTGSNGST